MNIRYAISDVSVMTGRVMKQLFRSVDTIITVLLMPVAMLLAMRYVFGGAMNFGVHGAADYVLPGIIIMCISSGVAYVAYRVNGDVKNGIFERFRSMPIAESSILGGHVISSIATNFVAIILVILIGLATGFRPQATLIGWLVAAVFILLLIAALTWMSVFFGLIARSPDTSGVFSYILLCLCFISSALVPVDSMPSGLAAFAKHQPMTPIANALRSLLLGEPAGGDLWIALAWCVAIGAAFWAAAVWAYKKRA
jgi:ABC-2 type transport system permease protein